MRNSTRDEPPLCVVALKSGAYSGRMGHDINQNLSLKRITRL